MEKLSFSNIWKKKELKDTKYAAKFGKNVQIKDPELFNAPDIMDERDDAMKLVFKDGTLNVRKKNKGAEADMG